jgi:hypothetical protein
MTVLEDATFRPDPTLSLPRRKIVFVAVHKTPELGVVLDVQTSNFSPGIDEPVPQS